MDPSLLRATFRERGTGSFKPFPGERTPPPRPCPFSVGSPPPHTHKPHPHAPRHLSPRGLVNPVDFRLCRGFLALIPSRPTLFFTPYRASHYLARPVHPTPPFLLPPLPPSPPTDGPMVKLTGICRQPHRNSLPSDRRVPHYSITGFAGRHGAGGPFSFFFFSFSLSFCCGYVCDGRTLLARKNDSRTLWRDPLQRHTEMSRDGGWAWGGAGLFSDVIRGTRVTVALLLGAVWQADLWDDAGVSCFRGEGHCSSSGSSLHARFSSVSSYSSVCSHRPQTPRGL